MIQMETYTDPTPTPITLQHYFNHMTMRALMTGRNPRLQSQYSVMMKKRIKTKEKTKDNKEDEDNREKRKTTKTDDPGSDAELNEVFRIAKFEDSSKNDEKKQITRAKLRPIKKNINKKNKSFSSTAEKVSLKEKPTSKINEEDNDETLDVSSNQDKDGDDDEEMTLDSKP